MSSRVTRREALAAAGAGAGALWLAGCGAGGPATAAADGSTLHSTWGDRVGDGQLRAGPGEPLRARTELGPVARDERVLATLAHVTDAHVMDAASPARVPFLERLGPPFQSTFRPQETLTARVLAGTLRAVRTLRPDAVIQGGDLIDNDQANELATALTLLRGGSARPGSGPHGYYGVQSPADPDPFYYRPDLDAPVHPGLLGAATRPLRSPGVNAPWYPVLGDHDVLVQGELVPSELTRALALGSRALWDLPRGLRLPPGTAVTAGGSPDGPVLPGIVDELLARALGGPTVSVPADPRRRELAVAECVEALHATSALRSGPAPLAGRLDYAFDVGAELRVIVLDLARRGGGSGGLVVAGQPQWLAGQLATAGPRWVIVVSHQPLISSQGGESLLALLDRAPRVLATLAGHIHRNSIVARATAAGGYWLITTASLVDYPQQARALQLVATAGGGVALRTWMLDHVDADGLGTIARELSYIDASGGRPAGFTGGALDRNVTLYRRPAD
jgi:3',5'-cyclic AMP phosphodiesterase CpdA